MEHSTRQYLCHPKRASDAQQRPRPVVRSNGANPPPRQNSRYGVGDEAPTSLCAIQTETSAGSAIARQGGLGRFLGVVVDRAEIRTWSVHEQFNAEGFEVFSVSLDQNADRWKAAIAMDGLNWPNHVCDLKAGKRSRSGLRREQHPHALLVDQNGTIAATHLRGPHWRRN